MIGRITLALTVEPGLMDKSLEKIIGKNARKARTALKMTQEEVAEQIGVTVEFYSRIERGAAAPSLDTLMRMATIFGVGADQLLGLAANETAQYLIKLYSVPPSEDPPELKRLIRRLRKLSPETIRATGGIVTIISQLSSKTEKADEMEAEEAKETPPRNEAIQPDGTGNADATDDEAKETPPRNEISQPDKE